MLRRVTIEGFKSLQLAEVDLGAVNVFIGANGSGKSNLLEALGVLGAASFRSVEPEALRYRGVRPGLPTLYKSAFTKRPGARRSVTRLIKLDVHSDDAEYRVALDNPIGETKRPWGIHSETLMGATGTVLTRSPRGFNVPGVVNRPAEALKREETFARQAVTLREDHEADALLERLSDYAIYTPTSGVLRGIDDDISRPPVGLSGSNLPIAVRDILRSRSGTFGVYDTDDIWELIDWADQISIVPSQQTSMSPAVATSSYTVRFRDKYMKDSRNTLSAYDASEGALYVLFLLALSCHPSAPRTFAVDNFDHALHPRLAASLTRTVCDGILAQEDRQLLLTTHNPLVLDGLNLTNDQIRLFAVERVRQGPDADTDGLPVGATRIRRIKPSEEILQAADSGLSLSRLWVQGRLGAIPRFL